MVASLAQFRRQYLPLASIRDTHSYIKKSLRVSTPKMVGGVKWVPACHVDREK